MSPNQSLKLCISVLYYIYRSFLVTIMQVLKKQPEGKLIILMYHGVKKHDRHKFARQMDELLRIAKPVSLDTQEHLKKGKLYVAVTFDDGYQNMLENAIPELHIRKIPATLFIPTGHMGKLPTWRIYRNNEYYDDLVLTHEQLKEISEITASHEPLFKIGSHTVSHSNLTSISGEQLKDELATSKKQLEDILNKEIDSLAVPYGEYNKEVCEIARQVGYKKIFSANPDSSFNTIDMFVSGRTEVSPNDPFFVYRLKLLGAYQWLSKAIPLKRKCLKLVGLPKLLRMSNMSTK